MIVLMVKTQVLYIYYTKVPTIFCTVRLAGAARLKFLAAPSTVEILSISQLCTSQFLDPPLSVKANRQLAQSFARGFFSVTHAEAGFSC